MEAGSWIRRGFRLARYPRADIVDKFRTNFLVGGLLDCKGCALNVYGTPFAHPVYLQIAPLESQVTVNPPHFPLWCRRFDSSAGTASGKEGVEVSKGWMTTLNRRRCSQHQAGGCTQKERIGAFETGEERQSFC